jgi:hypothetical protein
MDPNQHQQTFNPNSNPHQYAFNPPRAPYLRQPGNSLQQQQPLPQFESFPQPQLSTQSSLHQTLQSNPHDPYKNKTIHNLPSRDHVRSFFSGNFIQNIKHLDMAPTSAVPSQLNFITGNKNKLAEVQAILEGVIELRNQNVDLVEIQGTVEEVTRDKARRAAEAVSIISQQRVPKDHCNVPVDTDTACRSKARY